MAIGVYQFVIASLRSVLFTHKSVRCEHNLCHWALCIGECPSNYPFLKNNGAEAPKGASPIVFKEWRDTRTFSNIKSTHCTWLVWLIINLVTKKSTKRTITPPLSTLFITLHSLKIMESLDNRFTSQVDFK